MGWNRRFAEALRANVKLASEQLGITVTVEKAETEDRCLVINDGSLKPFVHKLPEATCLYRTVPGVVRIVRQAIAERRAELISRPRIRVRAVRRPESTAGETRTATGR